MLDTIEIEKAIASGDAESIARLIRTQNLEIKNGKIVADKASVKVAFDYWDQIQLIKKILLNS